MRKQFKTEKRVWTTNVYKKLYGKELPVSFVKSSEIIETMHEVMIEHLLKHHRPIELKKSIGYLEIKKCVIKGPLMVSSFIKARERNTPNYRVINYQTGGKTYAIRFQFSRYGAFRLYKFKALKKHRFEFYKMIQNKDVQEF